MRYKTLGNTNEKVSVITAGTWAIGGVGWGEVNEKDSIDALKLMVDLGCNVIDTAPAYGFGASEAVVGKALKEIGRDRVLISTKCGIRQPADGSKALGGASRPIRNATYAGIMEEIDTSLELLGTDHVDFYFLHYPDKVTPYEETVRAFEDLKKAGKIRFWGVSNFKPEEIAELYKVGTPDCVQYVYSMVERKDEKTMIEAAEKGICVQAAQTLGGGILTGAFRKPTEFPAGDMRAMNPYFGPKFNQIEKLLEVLDPIAAAHNATVAEVVLNWTVQNDYVATALTGVRNVNEVTMNCKAFDWELTPAEHALITEKVHEYLV